MPELDTIFGVLSKLLNLPDLIILAFLLVNGFFGLRHGLLRSLIGLVGKSAALAASVWAARSAAPVVAQMIVTPIVGEVFDKQTQIFSANALLKGLRQTAEEAAINMAESVAFAMLLTLFGVLFGWVVAIICKGLRFISHLTPISLLDALAGGIAGVATGAALVALILICIEWFAPITYSGLGWLSPQRVSDTLLLSWFIDMLPVAI